jgi:hypothetical protein
MVVRSGWIRFMKRVLHSGLREIHSNFRPKPEKKRSFLRPRRKLGYSIKIDLKGTELGILSGIQLPQHRFR